MQQEVLEIYGNRIRVRVCGICMNEQNELLMINHKFGETNTFWNPVGGGVEIGENLHDTLKREFLEETGLEISVGKLLFINDFIKLPLHAVELFFSVKIIGGKLMLGKDPEMIDNQLITDLKFMSMKEMKALPAFEVHEVFRKIKDILS